MSAAAAGLAVRALRIPPVAGYLLAGRAIGPFSGGYVTDVFTLGLDFSRLNCATSVRALFPLTLWRWQRSGALDLARAALRVLDIAETA